MADRNGGVGRRPERDCPRVGSAKRCARVRWMNAFSCPAGTGFVGIFETRCPLLAALQLAIAQPEDPIETADDLVVGHGDDRRLLLGRKLAKKIHHDPRPF